MCHLRRQPEHQSQMFLKLFSRQNADGCLFIAVLLLCHVPGCHWTLCLSRLSSLVYIFPLLGKNKTLSSVDYKFLIICQTKEVSSLAILDTKVCLWSDYYFPQLSVTWTSPSFVLFPALIVLPEKQHWISTFKNNLL